MDGRVTSGGEELVAGRLRIYVGSRKGPGSILFRERLRDAITLTRSVRRCRGIRRRSERMNELPPPCIRTIFEWACWFARREIFFQIRNRVWFLLGEVALAKSSPEKVKPSSSGSNVSSDFPVGPSSCAWTLPITQTLRV